MFPSAPDSNNRALNQEIADVVRAHNERMDNDTKFRSNPKEAAESLTRDVAAVREKHLQREKIGGTDDRAGIYLETKHSRVKKIEPEAGFTSGLRRIGQVFRETINSLLNFLGFVEQRKDAKKMYDDFLPMSVGGTIESSQKSMPLHKKFEAGEGGPGSLLTVPKNLLVEPEKLEDYKSKVVHTATAKLAVEKGTHLKLDSFIVTDFEAKLVPMSFDKEGKILPGEVTPTSYILGKPKTLEVEILEGSDIPRVVKPEEHLTNVYVLDLGPKQAVIRTGVINTEAKKDDFVKVIRQIYNNYKTEHPNEEIKLRVVSQQLNSFEAESKMIQDQHYMITKANQELKDIGEVIHINVPSNRWYHATKWVDSLGVLGTIMKAIAPMNFLQGERLSKALNLHSMGTYMNWVTADVSKHGEVNEKYKELTDQLIANAKKRSERKDKIDSAVEVIYSLKKLPRTEENLNILAAQKKILKETRKELKGILNKDYNVLVKIEEHYKSDEGKVADQKDMQTITLMRQVLGSQLGNKKQTLDRGQEGMAIQMLNDRLGIISAMNCKSGLDRTGIWHAIKLGMLSFEEKRKGVNGPERAFEMVDGWENATHFLNLVNKNRPGKHAGEILNLSNEEFIKELKLTEEKDISEKRIAEVKQKMFDVISFRNEVLNNLITMGIPITAASTGVMGLKWNTGKQENLIPLNFLPSHVQDENGDLIPLVKYNSKGEPSGITKEGAMLLTKHQKLRGS